MGMLFVRCRGGFSHSQLEHAEQEDVAAATAALFKYIAARD
jgi:allantoate deiminase